MTINLRFTPKDWERIQRDWTAWWHHEMDRPMTVINAYEWQGINFIPQFGGWDIEKDIFPVDQVLDYHQQNLENEPYLGDSWPRWWPNFGAGIVAAFLGAKVGVDENTVWFEPPANKAPLTAGETRSPSPTPIWVAISISLHRCAAHKICCSICMIARKKWPGSQLKSPNSGCATTMTFTPSSKPPGAAPPPGPRCFARGDTICCRVIFAI